MYTFKGQLYFVLLLSTLIYKSHAQESVEIEEIVAELSGKKPIFSDFHLKARSTSKEREITRKYLLAKLQQIGAAGIRHPYEQSNIHPLIDLIVQPFRGANIYTILPATKASNEYVVIGAHFDTERGCPGATDNSSGIAAVLSVIQSLRDTEERHLNIIGVFFDQEEEQTNGSKAFAAFLMAEGYHVHSVHTVDAIGWDSDQDGAVEIELPSGNLEALYRAEAEKLDIPIYRTGVNGSDHESFRNAGFTVTGITDELVGGDFSPFKDTPEDTFDKVNFDHIESTTTLITNVVKTICSAK